MYGYFDDQNREYVITTPKTPVKWINYIGSLEFGGFVDQTGGGIICKKDPALNRITKYIPQLPAADMNGETLYIRFHTEKGFELFSPFFTPVLKEADRYECRVGLGYNRYISEYRGIRTEITIFVPHGSQQVVRKISVTNIGNLPVKLDVIPVVEYTHFDALKQFTNADWVPQTMQSRPVETKDKTTLLKQYAFMNRGVAENFFTSNYPVSSFETDREIFLGNNGYGSWASPEALSKPQLSNTEAHRGNNIAALLHEIGPLDPQETKTIICQLGQCPSVEKFIPSIRRYHSQHEVDEALEALSSFWKDYLSGLQVNTPDSSFNTMINIHNPRQCFMTRNWSRYLSLYQLGLGARGLGFRDSSQDVMGVLSNAPEDGRLLIEKLLHVQTREGYAMHQFNPLSMEANAGDSREEADRYSFYGDDHLWIVLAVSAYIKETGNTDFLNKEIPFYEKDGEENPLETASIREHLDRGLRFTHEHCGEHGLPLLGFADWNDCVNLHKGAESVFIANLYGWAISEYKDILRYIGEDTSTLEAWYEDMRSHLNDKAWDGEWFIRYFDHDGSPIGSSANEKGKIYTNAQSWSVLSGFADPEKALSAMDSIRKHLNTRKGIKLSAPGYNGYDPDIGGITTYPPGAKENGGIFLHTNPWVMIAETKLGRGNYAYEYYSQINPATKNEILDEYECEPYCYVQNILGDEHPQFGLGRNSWLSGTASWTYQAATRYILGIRPECEGLRIDPCIPTHWKEITIQRHFRGVQFDITIHNPEGVSKGIKAITIDGKSFETNLIPVPPDATECKIEAVLG